MTKSLQYKVAVSATVSDDGSCFELIMQTEDGTPVTPQIIIDALGDYLITDPNGLFPPANGGSWN